MHQSYTIHICVNKDTKIQIGKLGNFLFLKGKYIYTGSAKKNMMKRINRHFSKEKKKYWHIDYLLDDLNVKIIKITKSKLFECDLHQLSIGKMIIKGFGSSDCKKKCLSHLKYRNK